MTVHVQNSMAGDFIRCYLKEAGIGVPVTLDATWPTPSMCTGTLLARLIVRLCCELDSLQEETLGVPRVFREKDKVLGELLYNMYAKDGIVINYHAVSRIDSDMSYAISSVAFKLNKTATASEWSAGLMEVADRERWGE